eukprot:g2272.t1
MLPELTCVVGKQQFAVFSQAISAAAKVGRELLLHADEQVLKLRCFSDTEQACLAFDFEKAFFEKYLVRATGGEIKCKVPLKCCQFAFRSAGKVEQMALTLHERIDHTICFNFRGKYATVKTCSFFYSKSEVFNVNFDKTKCMNRFTGRTGMLNELLTHIRGTDEMTLMVETKSQHVRLSSFHSSIEDAAIYKTLKTELSVNCTEFSEPHLERDVELTFNLTEFKALMYSSPSKCSSSPLSSQGDGGGRLKNTMMETPEVEFRRLLRLAKEEVEGRGGGEAAREGGYNKGGGGEAAREGGYNKGGGGGGGRYRRTSSSTTATTMTSTSSVDSSQSVSSPNIYGFPPGLTPPSIERRRIERRERIRNEERTERVRPTGRRGGRKVGGAEHARSSRSAPATVEVPPNPPPVARGVTWKTSPKYYYYDDDGVTIATTKSVAGHEASTVTAITTPATPTMAQKKRSYGITADHYNSLVERLMKLRKQLCLRVNKSHTALRTLEGKAEDSRVDPPDARKNSREIVRMTKKCNLVIGTIQRRLRQNDHNLKVRCCNLGLLICALDLPEGASAVEARRSPQYQKWKSMLQWSVDDLRSQLKRTDDCLQESKTERTFATLDDSMSTDALRDLVRSSEADNRAIGDRLLKQYVQFQQLLRSEEGGRAGRKGTGGGDGEGEDPTSTSNNTPPPPAWLEGPVAAKKKAQDDISARLMREAFEIQGKGVRTVDAFSDLNAQFGALRIEAETLEQKCRDTLLRRREAELTLRRDIEELNSIFDHADRHLNEVVSEIVEETGVDASTAKATTTTKTSSRRESSPKTGPIDYGGGGGGGEEEDEEEDHKRRRLANAPRAKADEFYDNDATADIVASRVTKDARGLPASSRPLPSPSKESDRRQRVQHRRVPVKVSERRANFDTILKVITKECGPMFSSTLRKIRKAMDKAVIFEVASVKRRGGRRKKSQTKNPLLDESSIGLIDRKTFDRCLREVANVDLKYEQIEMTFRALGAHDDEHLAVSAFADAMKRAYSRWTKRRRVKATVEDDTVRRHARKAKKQSGIARSTRTALKKQKKKKSGAASASSASAPRMVFSTAPSSSNKHLRNQNPRNFLKRKDGLTRMRERQRRHGGRSTGDRFDASTLAPTDSNTHNGTEPNWALNMEIVDAINMGGELGSRNAAKQIFRRLRQSNEVTKVLGLELLECCMKNCKNHFHKEIGTKDRMKVMIQLSNPKKTKNADIRTKALSMIADWGRAFERRTESTSPVFSETYRNMLGEGYPFPEASKQVSSPMFTPPSRAPAGSSSSTGTASSTTTPTRTDAVIIEKLQNDLNRVDAQLKLCKEMVSTIPPAGVGENAVDEALVDGIDFLDQCTPRLQRIIEASVRGQLKNVPEKEVGRLIATLEEVQRVVDDFIELEKCDFVPSKALRKKREDEEKEESTKVATKNTTEVDDDDLLGLFDDAGGNAPVRDDTAEVAVAAPRIPLAEPTSTTTPSSVSLSSKAPPAKATSSKEEEDDILSGLFDSI